MKHSMIICKLLSASTAVSIKNIPFIMGKHWSFTNPSSMD